MAKKKSQRDAGSQEPTRHGRPRRGTRERHPANQANESAAWQRMAAKYPGHPALEFDPIYALPVPLIEAIKQEKVPIFSDEDEKFERDLAEISGAGFCWRQIIYHPALPELPPAELTDETQVWNERQARTDETIRALNDEELKRRGLDAKQMAQGRQFEANMQAAIDVRRNAYAGWLVTNPAFHQARDQFRKQWGAKIKKLKGFPTLRRSLIGERPKKVPRRQQNYYFAYYTFYRDWGLETLATWDLPVPVRPELTGPNSWHQPDIAGAGMLIFVPWYLARDQEIKLHELADHEMVAAAPPHLSEWLTKRTGNWGYERFRMMFQLYIYLELSLKRRYPRSISRNIGKLDFAFARLFYGDNLGSEDSVKKMRLEMSRRLEKKADE